MSRAPYPKLCFYSHHKCATQWVSGILNRICVTAGWRFRQVYRPDQFAGDLAAFAQRERIDVLAYTCADPAQIGPLAGFSGFHLIRDPRDLVVSAYYSHRNSHPTDNWPELAVHRERLLACGLYDGLMREIEFRKTSFEHLAAWNYNQPSVIELKYESITTQPEQAFLHVFEVAGLLADSDKRGSRSTDSLRTRLFQAGSMIGIGRNAVPAYVIRDCVARHAFNRMSGGRVKGDEDADSHYRKGVAGDWVNVLEPDHLRYIDQLYPGLVGRLGYPSHPAVAAAGEDSDA